MPDQQRTTEVHRSTCDQRHRIIDIDRRLTKTEGRVDEMGSELSDGRVMFAELRKDIQAATVALQTLADQVREQAQGRIPARILDAAIFWAVPLVGGGLLWAIAQSQAAMP